MSEHEQLSLTFLITKASRAIIKLYQKELMPLGITLPPSVILRALLQYGPQTQSELGVLLLADKASVSTVIRQLRQKQLIETTSVAEDARLALHSLTDKGKELAEQIVAIDQRLEAELEKMASPENLPHIRHFLNEVMERGRLSYNE